jgi:putative intracellular protease/amidase
MTTIVTILTDGFADWETALLSAVGHSYYKAETHFASPGGKPVTSSGGMKVSPELALETLDLDKLDALVVSGGTIWKSSRAPDLTKLLNAARAKGKVIGLICDATFAAAKTGLLDKIDHTSNGEGFLDETGYKGKAHYQNVAHAVVDHKIITAPATAPVTFMQAVMKEVGLGDDQLDYFAGMYAAEHKKAA